MKTNHRRQNPPRYPTITSTFAHDYNVLHNGYAPPTYKPWEFIDKSLHFWGRISLFADVTVGSKTIGNDFSNGNRGMAKSVRGAKKFVRSRIRAKEKVATYKLLQSINE